MKKEIKLNEEQLRNIIKESIENYLGELDENEVEEGFGRNLMQGAKSFFGKGEAGKNGGFERTNGGLNIGKRFNAAKTNFQMTKEGDKINDVIKFLEDMVETKKLSPDMTIAQLIGGKLNNNKYGTLYAMKDNRTSRASKAMNDIYRSEE